MLGWLFHPGHRSGQSCLKSWSPFDCPVAEIGEVCVVFPDTVVWVACHAGRSDRDFRAPCRAYGSVRGLDADVRFTEGGVDHLAVADVRDCGGGSCYRTRDPRTKRRSPMMPPPRRRRGPQSIGWPQAWCPAWPPCSIPVAAIEVRTWCTIIKLLPRGSSRLRSGTLRGVSRGHHVQRR